MVIDFINNLLNNFTPESNLIFTLLFFTAIIVIYSVLIFYLYRFLARKNIITLDLNQYNKYEIPSIAKFFAIIFYILEYLIILPLLTFFWFIILAALILLLSEGLKISLILLISASLVASVRTTSYVNEKLSQDLAKMLPFTLLAIAITQPGFFKISLLFSRISEIPTLFADLPYYLLFMLSIEIIMRIIDLIGNISSFKGELGTEEKEEPAQEKN